MLGVVDMAARRPCLRLACRPVMRKCSKMEPNWSLSTSMSRTVPTDWHRCRQTELELGQLPETFTVSTPSGGEHRYFSVPKGTALKNSVIRLGPGVDVRANGGYVVAPGSELIGKGRYEITRHLPIAALPEDWIAPPSGSAQERAQ